MRRVGRLCNDLFCRAVMEDWKAQLVISKGGLLKTLRSASEKSFRPAVDGAELIKQAGGRMCCCEMTSW